MNGRHAKVFLTLLAAALLVALPLQAEEGGSQTKEEDDYPLDVCPISGEKLGGEMGDPIIVDYEGREVRFCCKSCVKQFNKDPEAVLANLDEMIEKGSDTKDAAEEEGSETKEEAEEGSASKDEGEHGHEDGHEEEHEEGSDSKDEAEEEEGSDSKDEHEHAE